MSAFILGKTTKSIYFFTMCGVSIMGFVCFLFLKCPEKAAIEEDVRSDSKENYITEASINDP